MKPARAVGPDALLGGRYRLERRIAGGGMATVWLGEDGDLGRSVAVKVLSDVLATDPAYRARFRREATVAARLVHPNLVRIYDFGDGERPYLVMEYVEGPSLAEVIDSGEPLAAEALARQLLGALDHIHGAGVVHRDVKPGNVLVDRRGACRLTDFGIAQPEDATRITDTGKVIGTLRYMAPEVARGGPATERSDLYSAGVVLGEAASGNGSPRLRELIDRLRAPRPDDRPASAAAALAILDEPGTEPTSLAAAPASPTAPTAPLPTRHEIEVPFWAILGAIAALAAVIVAVVLAAGGGGGGPPAPRHDAAGGHGPTPAGGTGSGGSASTKARRTTTQTTTSSPGAVPAPTAPAPKPPKAAKPAPPKEPKPPAGKTPPGLAKKPGGLPPGQVKKEQGGR